MKIRILSSILEVSPAEWDALAGDDNPFVEHAFLACLERSGSAGGRQSGWLPQHLVIEGEAGGGQRGGLIAAAPLWLRGDSYGEYIFDWGWAQAAQRSGLRYYPKHTGAIPFTPATGPRLLVGGAAGERADRLRAALIQGAGALMQQQKSSGGHWLFLEEADEQALVAAGWMPRASFQFHWRNRGWADFAAFEAALTRKRRHEIRRERKKVRDAGVSVEVKAGTALTGEEWDMLRTFYLSTVGKMGAIPYLNEGFFKEIRQHFAHRVVAVIARRAEGGEGAGRLIAGTLNFRKGDHLYGRYWGCVEEVPALHFECCYYALIEWAIAQKITLFEAGAQGEHKVSRGFLPALTRSCHRISHPGLSAAIGEFLARERQQVEGAIAHYMAESPFQAGQPGVTS